MIGGIARSRRTSTTARTASRPPVPLPSDSAILLVVPTSVSPLAAVPPVEDPDEPVPEVFEPLAPVDVPEEGFPEALVPGVPVLDDVPGVPVFLGVGALPPCGLPVGPTPVPGVQGPWPALSQVGGCGAITARWFTSLE